MKKKIINLIAVVLMFLMVLSVSACNLVTTDSKKDSEQVIAEVAISDDVPSDSLSLVYKKDLSIAYMNYGYYYSYSGYTQKQVYEMLLTQILTTRILAQKAMSQYFDDANYSPKPTQVADKWNVEMYLTKDSGDVIELPLSENNEAIYLAVNSLNSLIDAYEKAEDEKFQDTLGETVRTVPTNAQVDAEVTDEEKKKVLEDGIINGDVGSDRRKAYNKVIKLLEANNLLGDNYTNNDLKTSDYYKNLLLENQKSILLEKFQKAKEDEIRKSVSYQSLKDVYAEMFEAQQRDYANPTDFNAALSSASAKSPLVYTPYSGYGYVYNLLLGVNSIQEQEINSLTETDKTKRAEQRRDILAGITAKDLRATWLYSGYDFDWKEDTKTGVFTGDYTLCEADPLPFAGKIDRFGTGEDDDKYQYAVREVTEYSLDGFIAMMENYLYKGLTLTADATTNPSVYKKVTVTEKVDNYEDKINELLFAFSTDPGSLNTYKGYAIAPKPDFDGAETYMQEFADAGRELLNMGGSSYMVVATDYGYHFMYYSQLLSVDTNGVYNTLEGYLDSLDATKGGKASWEEYFNDMLDNWQDFEDTDFYLYMLMDAQSSTIVSTRYTEYQTGIYEEYENKIVKYTDRYADLLA